MEEPGFLTGSPEHKSTVVLLKPRCQKSVWCILEGALAIPCCEEDFSTPSAPGPLFLLGEASFLLAKARVMNEQKGVKGETRLLQKALQLLNERMDE